MTGGESERGTQHGASDVLTEALTLARMPLLVTDPTRPDDPVVFANAAFGDLTGYAPGEVVGRNARFLQGPETDAGAVRRVRAAVQDCREIQIELLNYRKDGSRFWNALTITPAFAPDGHLRYFCGSMLDATRRREAERARARDHRLEALHSLAGGMAHEFNNLLTVIRGNLELLGREAARPQITSRLDRVRDAVDRAAELTRAMISFARRQHLVLQTLDPSRFVRIHHPTLREAVGPVHRLELDLSSDPAPVRADATHLRTALINVLVNAREAMQPGGRAALRVQVERAPGGEPIEVTLAIEDEGRGMSPPVLARAIDPFFTTKPPGAGVGLGLSMVYGFMRQIGGRLQLDSREGAGTTVRLVFPVATEAGPTRPEPPHAS